MTQPDETAIVKLALRQRGVVSAAQLRAAGFDRAAVKRGLRAGRLRRLHRGVFQVDAAGAAPREAEIAALFACGSERSAVSHRSAALLWGLPVERPGDRVEITVAGPNPGRKPGIDVHRVATLDRRDVRRVEGVRVTAPARTLLDLAAVLSFDDLEVAYAEARGRRLVQQRDLAGVLVRNRGRRGAIALRNLLEFEQNHRLSRSQAERRFLSLVRAAGLTLPRMNTRIGDVEVDFLWPEQRLIVEVDGYAFHRDRAAFERDRERDAALAALSYVVMRVTWHQLVTRREGVVARLAGALAVRE